jgi:hypothetical protein
VFLPSCRGRHLGHLSKITRFCFHIFMPRRKSWKKDSMIKATESVRKKYTVHKLANKTFTVPRATLKHCVKKDEKSSQHQVETPLGNQLLQVTNATDSTPLHQNLLVKTVPSLPSPQMMTYAHVQCLYCTSNGKCCQDKTGDKWIRCCEHFMSCHEECTSGSCGRLTSA